MKRTLSGTAAGLFLLVCPLLFSCSDPAGQSDGTGTANGTAGPDPCTSILQKTLSPEASDISMSEDFGQLIGCNYLDSFELNYIVPNLIPEIMADMPDTAGSVTYQEIFNSVQRFRLTDRYRQIRRHISLLDSLRRETVSDSDWKGDTALLARLGMEKREITHLVDVVRELRLTQRTLTWSAVLDSTDNRLRRETKQQQP